MQDGKIKLRETTSWPPIYVSLSVPSQMPSWRSKGVSFSSLYGYIKWNFCTIFCSHIRQRDKEMSFNFHDGICDWAPRLIYVGGQGVVSRTFTFPPCIHLGAKMHHANGNILNIDFKVYVYSWNIFIYLLLCFRTGSFVAKAWS